MNPSSPIDRQIQQFYEIYVFVILTTRSRLIRPDVHCTYWLRELLQILRSWQGMPNVSVMSMV